MLVRGDCADTVGSGGNLRADDRLWFRESSLCRFQWVISWPIRNVYFEHNSRQYDEHDRMLARGGIPSRAQAMIFLGFKPQLWYRQTGPILALDTYRSEGLLSKLV